jgi:hypothetical protein
MSRREAVVLHEFLVDSRCEHLAVCTALPISVRNLFVAAV